MKTLLLWSVVLLVAGTAGAQTTPVQLPLAQLSWAPAQTGSRQAIRAAAIGTQAVAARASAGTTNSQPKQAQELVHDRPGQSFLEGVPELAFYEPKANELVLGRYTFSGMVVQVLKARRRLQLLNPAAPSRYGSGWDNVERFRASGSGPMLKLFAIDF